MYILQNVIHIAESTVGRRYAGWFIRYTEHAQRVGDAIRRSPLPTLPANSATAKKANGIVSANENGSVNIAGGISEASATGIATGTSGGVSSLKVEAKPAWGKAV